MIIFEEKEIYIIKAVSLESQHLFKKVPVLLSLVEIDKMPGGNTQILYFRDMNDSTTFVVLNTEELIAEKYSTFLAKLDRAISGLRLI